jgi:putative protein-disulfide isomerase
MAGKQSMDIQQHDQPCVIYAADAYCGWCYGFGPRLKEFKASHRDRVDFRIISGGLFVGERAQPIGRYAHIREANARITRLTGVRFGRAYNALVDGGTFVMDSAAAAAGLAALRAQDEHLGFELFERIQEAFYGEGRSLSDPQTYARIATACGLEPDRALDMLASGEAAQLANADFAMARRLGVTSYPTMLVIMQGRVHQLPATAATLELMNRELDQVLRAQETGQPLRD